jgi:hypothetical protein
VFIVFLVAIKIMSGFELKSLLDECGQSHVYEQTGLLDDPSNPILAQVRYCCYCEIEITYALNS